MQSNGRNIGLNGHLFYLNKMSLQTGNVLCKWKMVINGVMAKKTVKMIIKIMNDPDYLSICVVSIN